MPVRFLVHFQSHLNTTSSFCSRFVRRGLAFAALILAGGSLSAQTYTAPAYTVATNTGTIGRLNLSYGVAVDANGAVYVADAGNQVILKFTGSGAVTTVAGVAGAIGSLDSSPPSTTAWFNTPRGVAIDGSGNLYIADSGNHTIRMVTSGGIVTTLAGMAGELSYYDGVGTGARFTNPSEIVVNSAGTLAYVTDRTSSVVRKISISGGVGTVTTLAGSAVSMGSTDATGGAARFRNPRGLALDNAGNVYVADTDNHTIRKITSAGVVTTLAGSTGNFGSADGTGTAARFNSPQGLAVDSAGNIYVADKGNHTVRRITSAGVVTTLAGSPGLASLTDGTSSAARFNAPRCVAVDGAGNIYVSQDGDEAIRWAAQTAPVLTSATAANGMVAEPFSYTATFSGVLTNFTASGLPAGLSIDQNTGVISGTPTVAGTFPVTLGTGNPAGSSSGSLTLTIVPSYTFAVLAGTDGVFGGADGTGAAAEFNSPAGAAIGTNGTLYVADTSNCTIRKITGGGVTTTLAGSLGLAGSTNGTGAAARFNSPRGVAVDSSGTVYVADTGNHTIRKITSGGAVTTLAGSPGLSGTTNATGTAARFNSPRGVAVDGSGNVYVADYGNHLIRKITSGGVVTTLAGSGTPGTTDATGTAAQFNLPRGLAVDSSGNVYVADGGNHTIRKITSGGVVTTLAGTAGVSGLVNATGTAAKFNSPSGVAVDASGTVYVADQNNGLLRKITSSGVVTTLAGSTVPGFSSPAGVAVDTVGNVYVVDLGASVISWGAQYVPSLSSTSTAPGTVAVPFTAPVLTGTIPIAAYSASGLPSGLVINRTSGAISGTPTTAGDFVVTLNSTNPVGTSSVQCTLSIGPSYTFGTLAGLADNTGSTDGTGVVARFDHPNGVAVDTAGNVYVADSTNQTIRKITAGGVVTTLAGLAGNAGSADGTGSAARFYNPTGIAVDTLGNVYVADTNNRTIRKITAGGVVTTLAGLALNTGSADGSGSSARFNFPNDVAVDGAGNVYVGDTINRTIRKITAGGVVTTLAGLAESIGSTDDVGSNARFTNPQALAVDSAGTVYVSDFNKIRKVTSNGTVTTLAGDAGVSAPRDGVGSGAWFYSLGSICVDAAGRIYVADYTTNTIRQISNTGVVSTLAGTNYSADQANGTGAAAKFDSPSAIDVDSAGNLYVADTNNSTIRWGSMAPPVLTSATTASGTVSQSFSSTVTFSGALTGFSASGLPAGLTINTASGVISGTPTAAGTFPVTLGATNGAGSATATLTITISKATASVTLGSLSATYDGSPHAATATTTPGSLSVSFTYNGSATAPTNAGTYTVVATINDATYQGSASGTLVIGKATATVTLGGLSALNDGSAHAATTVTSPGSLAVTLTYNGSPTAPTNAGTYAVVATINDANYEGGASGTLVISNVATAITTQPASQGVLAGSSAVFTVAATGAPAPTFQWQRLAAGSGTWVNLIDGGGYSGVTTATLTISGVTDGMNGDQFRCVTTNSVGSVTSTAVTLTVGIVSPSSAVVTITVE